MPAHKTGMVLICSNLGCDVAFYRKRSELSHKNYCSRRCYDAMRPAKPTTYKKSGTRHLHRVVAERLLGRPIRVGEVVHHIDGDKQNNEPENIEVLTSQSEHAKVHSRRGEFTRWR